jgi:hypothetical protein
MPGKRITAENSKFSKKLPTADCQLPAAPYLRAMKEPKHPHFVLSDGEYCQLVDGKLVIGKRDLPEHLPVPTGKPDYVMLGLMIFGLLLLGFFLGMTIVAHYYVVTFTLAVLFLTLGGAVYKSAGYTSTKAIVVADIVGVDYKKKMFGYDYFIIHYAGPNGKDCKRRLTIYDSPQCLEQALSLMRYIGFLK